MLKANLSFEFNHLISSIKRASSVKKDFIIFKKAKSHSNILQLLVNIGFIKSYQEFNDFIIIKLKFFNQLNKQNFAFSLIKQNIRLSRKYTVSLSELVRIQRREGGSSYFILNTDKGLLTSFDAISKNIGGVILFKIS